MGRKVVVDELMCEGHGRCEDTAPEVFRLEDDDVSRVLVDEVPEDQVEAVEQAIRVCPRQAIRWAEAS